MRRFGVHEGGGEGGGGEEGVGASSILPASLLERFADKLGVTARAATVFGEAVERDGVTVIPVARAKWGLGGGGGHRRPGAQEGMGGGGGVTVAPVGYIEVKDGQSSFRPIWDPMTRIIAAVGGGIGLLLILRGLAGLRRDPDE
jgi:uncharacterized spore protein YtfJ